MNLSWTTLDLYCFGYVRALGFLDLPYFISAMKAAPVCERGTGSGGRSRSAPFPVTQHRHRCDWTAGKGGKKKARGRKERGEKTGDWRIIAADAGIYTLFHVRHVFLFFRSTETGIPLIQSCYFTNTPPCSCVTGWREESRPNQWPFDRSSSGRPGTEKGPHLVRFTVFEKQSTEICQVWRSDNQEGSHNPHSEKASFL